MATHARADSCLALLLASALLLCSWEPAVAQPKTHIITVIGDSLSDGGSDFERSNNSIPDSRAYYKGRFSNGPNWVDHMADDLKAKGFKAQVNNYAAGGATACSHPSTIAKYPWVMPSATQTDLVLAAIASGAIPANDSTNANSLFIEWTGNNDLIDYFNAVASSGKLPSSAELAQFVANVTACRISRVRALALAGARDIACLDNYGFQLSPHIPASYRPLVAQLAQGLNDAMAGAIAQLLAAFAAAPASSNLWLVNVPLISTQPIFELAPAALNMTHLSDKQCFGGVVSALDPLPAGYTICPDPEKYLFVDPAHVTASIQKFGWYEVLAPALVQWHMLPGGLL